MESATKGSKKAKIKMMNPLIGLLLVLVCTGNGVYHYATGSLPDKGSNEEVKEINLQKYNYVLDKQKELNSAYFNQKVTIAISDLYISKDEYTALMHEYKKIIKSRKYSNSSKNNRDVLTNEDRLNSIKKEIRLHAQSQNDNLI